MAFRAAVIGGSLGGLAAANELTAIGADVAVYDRSAGLRGLRRLPRTGADRLCPNIFGR
ncbi:NAD(P)-binding protein [Mycolicibacterium sp. S2-37]|uniref:NAD(P)-binding protein n=1 Tax=Mycolicibacterium sp. S2-37 TaxID=2810297 RepID=UPI0035AB95D3